MLNGNISRVCEQVNFDVFSQLTISIHHRVEEKCQTTYKLIDCDTNDESNARFIIYPLTTGR